MAKKIDVSKEAARLTKQIIKQTQATQKNTKARTTNTKANHNAAPGLDQLSAALFAQTTRINQLTKALEKNNRARRRNTREGVLGFEHNRLLTGSFAVLRSKLLLVAFGYAMVSKTVGVLLKQNSDFQASVDRINSGLESTGRFTIATSRQMMELSDEMEILTGVAGTQVNEVIGLGLTFTNISTSTMPAFTKAALDMTAGMNAGKITAEGLKSSSIILGKALNDPITGLSALSRVGVQFSDAQKNLIQTSIAFGDTLTAQQIILKEVDKQFKGKASLDNYEKTMRDLDTAIGNLQRAIGKDLAPVVESLAKSLKVVVEQTDTRSIAEFAGVFTGLSATLLIARKSLTSFLASQLGLSLSTKTLWERTQKYLFTVKDGQKVVVAQTNRMRALMVLTRILSKSLGVLTLAFGGTMLWFSKAKKSTKELNDETLNYIDTLNRVQSPTAPTGEATEVSLTGDALYRQKVDQLSSSIEGQESSLKLLNERVNATKDAISGATTGTNEYTEELELLKSVLSKIYPKQEAFSDAAIDVNKLPSQVSDALQTIESKVKAFRNKSKQYNLSSSIMDDEEFSKAINVVTSELDKLSGLGVGSSGILEFFGQWVGAGEDASSMLLDTRGNVISNQIAVKRLSDALSSVSKELKAQKDNLDVNNKSYSELKKVIEDKESSISSLKDQLKEYQVKLGIVVEETEDSTTATIDFDSAIKGTMHTMDIASSQGMVAYIEKLKQINSTHEHSSKTLDDQLIPLLLKYKLTNDAITGKPLIDNDGLYDTVAILKQFRDYATLDDKDIQAINQYAKEWELSADEIKKAVLAGQQVNIIQAELKKDATDEQIQTWANRFGEDVDELREKLQASEFGLVAPGGEDTQLIVTYNSHFAELLKMFELFQKNKPWSIFDKISDAMGFNVSHLKEVLDAVFDVANAYTKLVDSQVQVERQTIQTQYAQKQAVVSEIRNQTVRALYEKKLQDQKDKDERELFKKHKKNQIAMAWIAGAQGILNVLMEPAPKGMTFPVASVIRGLQIAAIGATTKAQVDTIKSQETFATGGYVSGPSHNMGGVQAELEGGEFVMRKSAVDRYGIDFMKDINQGSTSPGNQIVVNVTFTGNVNSDQFIEDEVIPQIQSAIQRGVNLGDA
tara:strand:+ start:2257 stop:5655 length:3399 start_codon:yes stop_codon:yes gene_type:complete